MRLFLAKPGLGVLKGSITPGREHVNVCRIAGIMLTERCTLLILLKDSPFGNLN